MILECKHASSNCQSKFQDTMYGKGRRVHNPLGNPKSGQRQARCTVCANVRDIK